MDNAKVIERIVKGLTQKPAYLLAFGVFFLLLGGGLAAALVNSNIASNALILAGIALVALIAVIFIVEREGRGAPVGRTGDTDFDPILDAIYQQLRSALGRSHPVFRDRMKRECEQFRAVTSLWASGQLRTTQRVYNEMLLEAYERAETSVFATSTLDYLPAWKGFLGEEILKSHVKGKAAVTRVFIFNSLEGIPPDCLEVMKKQVESGKVAVRLYGIRETVRYEIPDGLNINFAVIDEGEIIASTDPSGGEQFTGTFYFKEAGFRETYRGVVEELTRGSIPFEEFAQRQGLQQDAVAL